MNADFITLHESANAHHLAGRYTEAIQDYQASLQLNPRNTNAHYDLHIAYRDTGQLLLAFQELEVAVRIFPGDKDIYAAVPYLYDVLALSKNTPALQEIISQLPSDAKDREVLLGLRARRQKDYPQALTHFEKALREQPDIPYIQAYIGSILIYLGRNAEARVALTTVASDKRVRSTELYNLAIAERNLRNYAAALPALKRAVQIDEDYYIAWRMLASTELYLGHWRSAWHYILHLATLSPELQTRRSK